MKKIHFLKTPRPKGTWLTDADLRHDAAIELGCPAYRRGEGLTNINIQIPCETLREFQKQHGDHHLVIDPNLIELLVRDYLLSTEVSGVAPQYVELPHLFPLARFRVEVNSTVRVMGSIVMPGPVNYLTFWYNPIRVVIHD